MYNIKSKSIYCAFFLGLLSSSSLADTGNYFAFVPNKANNSSFFTTNSNVPSWQGIYINSKYTNYDKKDNISITGVSIGYDSQDGNLVYGMSLGLDKMDQYDINEKSKYLGEKPYLSASIRSGFTLNNDNSSIFQNTLFYGLAGVRAKNIEKGDITNLNRFVDKIKSVNKDNTDMFVGVGLEKKLASFLSLDLSYRYTFDHLTELKSYDKILNNALFSAGLSIRL
ncbi:outer membrane protein [Candidatus Liberibacter americanus]|uniref:Outer membrane protein beta-barrel domain-containing protein n=1 Tax=Candidatus Liberibacter americanus str. Sao Paulo TaxID=1261131 RepID=U6B4Z0_9HYPH|nr:outer membrane beta-barrel protein [Candidatus Liberibacter americanus]AHA28139.1 hypothetical protein lam_798 [Candidatus Liberibacter americanus str. Sao Paulo]EMS35949.1 hypothetical protein G653_04177 [Candidatus Liberibacter americanus PW_SP]